jgi:hypothetical protein
MRVSGSTVSDEANIVGHTRVVVLYEHGRSGAAALDAARRLLVNDGPALRVAAVAPQDRAMWCGAASAVDFNSAVQAAVSDELDEARELIRPWAVLAVFKLLVEGQDPPLPTWISDRGFDVVLLPARGATVRRPRHPAAAELRGKTAADVRVIDGRARGLRPEAERGAGEVSQLPGTPRR